MRARNGYSDVTHHETNVMSAIVETFLICDGIGCGETFGVDNRDFRAGKHRENAKANGWIYFYSKDFCPKCTEHINNTTKRKQS
jgi:hypothetical protein